MYSPEKTDRQLIQETHDAVIELTAVVLGVKGQGGLVQDLKEVKLKVTEMTFKSAKGDVQVAELLDDFGNALPRIESIEKELHKKKEGVLDRLTITEEKQRFNRILIYSAWTVLAAIAGALMYLFFSHVDATQDAALVLFYLMGGC